MHFNLDGFLSHVQFLDQLSVFLSDGLSFELHRRRDLAALLGEGAGEEDELLDLFVARPGLWSAPRSVFDKRR